jgi:benzoyl-CoA reductase/2-hydroxyglutaryl-CoA dehydratase subunit BcrC/BadD/HgdB
VIIVSSAQPHVFPLQGSLTTGKGNRFILANTEVLHEKISELSNRVRELEDALARSHSLHTHEPHPLLREDLLSIKRPLEREKDENPVQDEEEKLETSESVGASGSLYVSLLRKYIPITMIS